MKLSFRIWLLIAILLLSALAMSPRFDSGVVIKSVEKNSSAFEVGIKVGEVIKSVNGQNVNNQIEYAAIIDSLLADGVEKKIEIKTKGNDYVLLTNESPKITVEDIQRTRIQMGLDLRGGARALVQPNASLTDQQLGDLVQISRNRFNVYGLSDINIRGVSDLDGNKYMLVEVAGATPADLEQLVSQQGKFEAKVANQTVFTGGKQDIGDVCRNDAKCAGIERCDPSNEGYACSFRFTLYLTEVAANRHAEITRNISLDTTGKYLTENIYFYVDDKEVDSLKIGADLRGQASTQISIQGPGTGRTSEEAYNNAKENMNKLQTILLTGSLPYKLTIVKLDTISPMLGKEFTYYLLIAGLASMIGVALVVFIRYRKIKISLAMIFTSFSEIAIILGVAALIRWNLDLPSIAGILATIGTGVDQQIIILDEAKSKKVVSLKEKMKRAMFIIVGAYCTALVSLLPLYWAGAGLFKGFATTTLIGITIGVLITRPAFSDMIKKMEGDTQ